MEGSESLGKLSFERARGTNAEGGKSWAHLVNSLERIHCADGSCREKFKLTERKYQYRRYVKSWLTLLADLSSNVSLS